MGQLQSSLNSLEHARFAVVSRRNKAARSANVGFGFRANHSCPEHVGRSLNREELMRIAVMGAGALGCYIGGRLAVAGRDVSFVARGTQLDALDCQGLRIDSR